MTVGELIYILQDLSTDTVVTTMGIDDHIIEDDHDVEHVIVYKDCIEEEEYICIF